MVGIVINPPVGNDDGSKEKNRNLAVAFLAAHLPAGFDLDEPAPVFDVYPSHERGPK